MTPTTTSVLLNDGSSTILIGGSMVRKRDSTGIRANYSCESCGKDFTTKFNLKRHINMHCHKSKEAGVPIQGPPSASAPSRKKSSHNTNNNHQITAQTIQQLPINPLPQEVQTVKVIQLPTEPVPLATTTTTTTTTTSTVPPPPPPQPTPQIISTAQINNQQLVKVINNTNHLLRNTSIPACISSITISGGPTIIPPTTSPPPPQPPIEGIDNNEKQ